MDSKTTTVILDKKKDCKGSVCFETKDIKAAMSSAYINRIFGPINDAQKIEVTIKVIG